MLPVIQALVACVASRFRSRRSLPLNVLPLPHQGAVYQRWGRRPHLHPRDRGFWAWLSRLWTGGQEALVFVQPRTGIAWQRPWFREHWRRLSHGRTPGRPAISQEGQDLIRKMSQANPTWGAPRLVGELRKLGIAVAKSPVETYRVRSRKPPSPPWRAFLQTHVIDLVSGDFFVVPTVTYEGLFVRVILVHHRRRVVRFNVTAPPTAAWTAPQVIDAFPWDEAPRYLLRDRDRISRACVRQRVRNMGIADVVIAPRSPWQNPYVERLIGSIHRACLDHVIGLHERPLRRLLTGDCQ